MTTTRSTARAGHLVRLCKSRLGAGVVWSSEPREEGDLFAVDKSRLLELIAFFVRDPDADLSLLTDVFGVDRGADADPRFEVHVLLHSPRLGYRAHLVVNAGTEEPSVPSLSSMFPAAIWLEREMYEMFGIWCDGHPQLRPLLLYPGFVGHPLRRDYRAHKAQPLVPLVEDEVKPVVIVDDATAGGGE